MDFKHIPSDFWGRKPFLLDIRRSRELAVLNRRRTGIFLIKLILDK